MIRQTLALLSLLLLLLSAEAGAGLFDSLQKGFDVLSSSADATKKAARPITEEEEYYIGRAVAARILSTYPLLKDPRTTEYVNSVGAAVALHSDKPFTYGGYHFAVLDAGEINAFACPGGIIFITKGMLNSVQSEDELAAVLAHEIAHISHRDGIGAIKKSRWTEALTVIGSKTAQNYGPQELSTLTGIFEGSIDDIVKTLVVKGYSKSQEYAADKAALPYTRSAGYYPAALSDYLTRSLKNGASAEGGMLKTHPGTQDRIDSIQSDLAGDTAASSIAKRSERFTATLR